MSVVTGFGQPCGLAAAYAVHGIDLDALVEGATL